MNSPMGPNCVWSKNTRVSRIQRSALCSEFKGSRHRFLLRGFKNASWFLALSWGRGMWYYTPWVPQLRCTLLLSTSLGKLFFPLHLCNSIHIFRVNIPRQQLHFLCVLFCIQTREKPLQKNNHPSFMVFFSYTKHDLRNHSHILKFQVF